MAYIEFNKKELVNLEYSLKREYLSTNRAGGYLNTTISGCNTRKYHGLLVLPIDNFNGEKHVLLSSLDESLIQHGKEFNLGIHCYGEIYEPRGHKYIVNLELDKAVAVTYSVGGMKFRKVVLLSLYQDQVFISYTLLEANSPTTLRLKPFLAFRHIHSLSKANNSVNRKFSNVDNGISLSMYEGFPELFMQTDAECEFVPNPDWYYNIEYKEESRRVYDSKEDLYVPGFFEMPIKKGETIIFSASTSLEDPSKLRANFDSVINKKRHRDSFLECLKISADQFIIKRGDKSSIYPGYPWLDSDPRETLLTVAGLTLFAENNDQLFFDIIDSFIADHQDFLFKKSNQPDTALWLFWALQQYSLYFEGKKSVIYKRYGQILKRVLDSFIDGSKENVIMHDTALLWAEESGVALSWMDAYVNGYPVTERVGYQVELNALWYNAICYYMDIMPKNHSYIKELKRVKELLEHNYPKAFCIYDCKYLADYLGPEGQNKFVRPNQLFTCSFEFSPIDDTVKNGVLNLIKHELLNTRGIRTLSPKNAAYKGEYDGDQTSRDSAYHQGTSRVWLLSFYIEASLKLYGQSFVSKANDLVMNFQEEFQTHCVGSISEVFDGDPPHQPHGCTSYAGSVASLLRSIKLIEKYKNSTL